MQQQKQAEIEARNKPQVQKPFSSQPTAPSSRQSVEPKSERDSVCSDIPAKLIVKQAVNNQARANSHSKLKLAAAPIPSNRVKQMPNNPPLAARKAVNPSAYGQQKLVK